MGNLEIITRKNFEKVAQEFEDSLIRVWKISKKLLPKMYLDFRVHFEEVYASIVGIIWAFTPFWRGKNFTEAILLHEFLHWAVYPIDLFKGLEDLYKMRSLLAEELKYTPKIKKTNLFSQEENWDGFEYSIGELSFIQNIFGDYLVNLHISEKHPKIWKTLWKFLYSDGTFYHKQKALKRDGTYILYLSVYPELLSNLEEIKLIDKTSEKKREQIVTLIKENRKGRISNVFTLKELAKIFHNIIQEDMKEQTDPKPPECPKCHNDEFEIVGYEDPITGKWIDV